MSVAARANGAAAQVYVPPHDLGAEEYVVAAMMRHDAPHDEIRAICTRAEFYRPALADTFDAICHVLDRGETTDDITVTAELRRLGVTGLTKEELRDLLLDPPMPRQAVDHARIVHDLAVDRHLIGLLERWGRAIKGGQRADVLAEASARLDELAGEGLSADVPGASWCEVDLTDTVAGYIDGTIALPMPAIGRRDDGTCLFYMAKVNALIGPPGDGKTFVADVVVVQEIEAGHHVAWVDFEDDQTTAVGRLLDLGAEPRALLAQFHYFSPLEPFSAAARARFTASVAKCHPTLVVLDSAGESMSIEGIKPNEDDSVARWSHALPRYIAGLGPCVVYIDHTPKGRGDELDAAGSFRKRAAITGSSFLVTAVQEFGKDRCGRAKLVTAKDRQGNFVRGAKAAELVLDATTTPYGAVLEMPTPSTSGDGTFRPTVLMEKVSRWLEINPGAGRNMIERSVEGKAAYVRQALGVLIGEGRIRTEPHGQSIRHYVITPFREFPDEPVEEPF